MIRRVASLRKKIEKIEAQRDVYKQEYDKANARYHALVTAETDNKEAADLLWAVVEAKQKESKEKIEKLVTAGLRAVFGRDDMTFVLEATGKSASRRGIRPLIQCEYGDYQFASLIPEGHGGGVADVASFLLRVVMLSIMADRSEFFIVLDESFKHVSVEYLRNVASLITELSKSLGIQFVLITHKNELLDAADVIYRAKMDKYGVTTFSLEHDMIDDAYHDSSHKERRDTWTAFDGMEPGAMKPTKVIK